MKIEELLAAVDRFLEAGGEARDPNEVSMKVSFDGGKTFKDLGTGCIGEIHIVRASDVWKPGKPPGSPD